MARWLHSMYVGLCCAMLCCAMGYAGIEVCFQHVEQRLPNRLVCGVVDHIHVFGAIHRIGSGAIIAEVAVQFFGQIYILGRYMVHIVKRFGPHAAVAGSVECDPRSVSPANYLFLFFVLKNISECKIKNQKQIKNITRML